MHAKLDGVESTKAELQKTQIERSRAYSHRRRCRLRLRMGKNTKKRRREKLLAQRTDGQKRRSVPNDATSSPVKVRAPRTSTCRNQSPRNVIAAATAQTPFTTCHFCFINIGKAPAWPRPRAHGVLVGRRRPHPHAPAQNIRRSRSSAPCRRRSPPA